MAPGIGGHLQEVHLPDVTSRRSTTVLTLWGGVNATVSIEVVDWMTVKGWGQYAFYQKGERTNPSYAAESLL